MHLLVGESQPPNVCEHLFARQVAGCVQQFRELLQIRRLKKLVLELRHLDRDANIRGVFNVVQKFPGRHRLFVILRDDETEVLRVVAVLELEIFKVAPRIRPFARLLEVVELAL